MLGRGCSSNHSQCKGTNSVWYLQKSKIPKGNAVISLAITPEEIATIRNVNVQINGNIDDTSAIAISAAQVIAHLRHVETNHDAITPPSWRGAAAHSL